MTIPLRPLALVALALMLFQGCLAGDFEPHYLQHWENPREAIEDWGYEVKRGYVGEGIGGTTNCLKSLVTMKDLSRRDQLAHEYIHVQQQVLGRCLFKHEEAREKEPCLAQWIYRGCPSSNVRMPGLCSDLLDEDDLDSALCWAGGPHG